MTDATARESLEAVIRAHGWVDPHNSGVGRCRCFTMDEPHCSFETWAAHFADVLLAARVPCPTCGGTGKVRNPSELGPGMHVNTVSSVPCPACDDGRGGPLVLLAPIRQSLDRYPHAFTPVYVARPENTP